MSTRFTIRVVICTLAATCVGIALLRLGATLVMGIVMGGPFEPPQGMNADEFKQWCDSGQWWKATVYSSCVLIIISAAIAAIVTYATRHR